MSHSLREVEQRNWYTANAGADRNDLRANRGVLFQTLATERSFIRAFSQITEPASTLKVLDIGCGSGAGWYQLFRLGVKPNNMTGIEIQSERLDHVADLYPQATAVLGDASCIPLADGSFDLVYESTLFATLTDDHLRKDIASEMIRVCKSSGYLLLIDWRIQKFWDPNFGVLNKRELKRLFGVGKYSKLVCITPGSLIPPLGRLLSKYAWPLYFLVAWLCPPLVGQVAYLLQKQSSPEIAHNPSKDSYGTILQ
jgi:ubiquinone/menaquinone biosynthesis C-methylase UbiE